MIEFKFACPHCRTHIQCDVSYTGWQINCPACKQSLVVPPPGMAAPPAAAASAQAGKTPAASSGGKQCTLALVSVILSALGIPGIICGHIARAQIKRNPQLKGAGLALAGMIIGYVSLAVTIAAVVMLKTGSGAPATAENSATPNATAPQVVPTSGRSTSGSVIWADNFETGLDNWEVVPEASALAKGNARTISGANSAKVTSSQDKMFRNIGFELGGPAKATFWIYDSTQARVFGEVRGYAGKGYGKGALNQILAIGRYDIAFGNQKGSVLGEEVDKRKYQGRVVAGENVGWFNLNGPGSPIRSGGWHKFEIERLEDGSTINFYVDGILSRTITAAVPAPWDAVCIGSLGTGSATPGEAWFDDVKIEELKPSPSRQASK